MRKIYVFYHSSDLDGKCSAAIVAMAHNWEVELVPINYNNEKFNWDKINPIDTVYMVDFGLQPFSRMVSLDERCELIWIDHHVTAIEDYERYINNAHGRYIKGYRKVGDAACELVWRFFEGDARMSKPVYLMGRYDVWKHFDIPDAIPFQYGMELEHANPKNRFLWEKLIIGTDKEYINDIINTGKTLYEFDIKKNARKCRVMAFETEFEGHKVIALNDMPNGSLVFESVWNPEKHDFMMVFARTDRKWTLSLYTDKEGINVGEIAKKYGGGGHKGAAGFSCEVLPFEH